MTIVVLNPDEPDMVPVDAVTALQGAVVYTEDVPIKAIWGLPNGVSVHAPGDDGVAPDATLLTTNLEHPLVRRRIEAGDRVVGAGATSGGALLAAVAVMDTLRSKGPWERKQSHESLRPYLIEETYELLDAIDSGDRDHLREELSDLLLQVLFHARIAADDPDAPFDIDDVAREFTDKMQRRAPSVLGGTEVDIDTQVQQWESTKAEEKQRDSALDGIARSQPALALVQKVLDRLLSVGFPINLVPSDIRVISVHPGEGSAEDKLRRRVLAFMELVEQAETSAARSATVPRSSDAWRQYFPG